jgi:eukaryotic-like serine/threonine-protein kinase
MPHQQQRYRVLEKIATGGMAEVFRAESAGLEGFKKVVAIKRVLPHLAEKKQFIGMFLDEARVSAQLSHSNCVQVFDIGVGDNTYFIVMEYVDGADLKAVLEHQRKFGKVISAEEAMFISVRICEGLAYAHELTDSNGRSLHVVHRDMSPPNVLITRHGEVKIVDFGLAKANSQLEHSEPGIIKGKFGYLSPEAAKGFAIDHRTDIFAVGIILWEMLAGRRLFSGETDLQTVRMVQAARVPPLRQFNPRVSPELEGVLGRALAAEPDQRYQSAREFGRDLNHLLFRLGRPVSSFDIAALVDPIRSEREIARRGGERGRSFIGSLIDQALFEFTSIEGKDTSSPSVGSSPLNIGAFDAAPNWAENLGQVDRGARSANMPQSRKLELGNLAALEDDAPSARRQQTSVGPTGNGPEAIARRTGDELGPTSGQSTAEAAAVPRKGHGTSGTMKTMLLVALLLMLLLIVGAAGVALGGAIP